MDLTKAANDLVADYSHGMRKKIALSAALLPAPRLLFLDEPFEGIDAIASRQIKDLLATFVKNGGTVFLTTHVLEIVERLCDHIGIINKGRMVTQGSMAELRAGGVSGQSLEERFMEIVGASDRRCSRSTGSAERTSWRRCGPSAPSSGCAGGC